jgi:hypothetical protein
MKEIIDQLEAILRLGYSPHNVFNDWLDLMLFALQRDDEHYLEIVRKYKNDRKPGEREIDYFCHAFAYLQMEMQKTYDDILGQVYMQWNQNNKYHGQFFTPKHIANMMALMIEPKGKILDPCCGSGVMLIAALQTMDNDKLDKAEFFGQDIDLTCAKMCALNLMFFNVNGFVVWGDSLKLECNKVYLTTRSYLGGSIKELVGEEFELFKTQYLGSLNKSEVMKATDININSHISNNQLMLF